MHLGSRHQSLRRRGVLPHMRHKLVVRIMDTLAYCASSLSLFFTLDQVRIIWINHTVEGVSLFAWLFYTNSAFIWLLYGYVHKDRVLIITNCAWVLFSLSIVVGIILFR